MLTLFFGCFQFVPMRGGYIVFVILGIVRGVRGGEGWVDEREDRGGEGDVTVNFNYFGEKESFNLGGK